MKEDNISQSGDYDAPFCEQTIHAWVLLYLFVQINSNHFDQLRPPKLPQFQTFTQLCCCTIVMSVLRIVLAASEILRHMLDFRSSVSCF